MSVRLYVEGGGDHNKALQTLCRKGFSEFIRKSGLDGRMPRIVACGGRRQAYKSFLTAHRKHVPAALPILLVDSECPVHEGDPWAHVMNQPDDRWQRPDEATGDQLHMMVQAMEAWFHADREALQAYYGPSFRSNALKDQANIETIPKTALFAGLRAATVKSQKGGYEKGEHSFEILARINPAKVSTASPRCGRFLSALDHLCT